MLVDPAPASLPRFDTLLEVLQQRSDSHGHRVAYTFRSEDARETNLTFAELAERSKATAVVLREFLEPGDRVLLVYPAGLDFIVAFLGCVAAGVLPVPATYPKPKRPMSRLQAITRDCMAKAALTTSHTQSTLDLGRMGPELQSIRWIATDRVPGKLARHWEPPILRPDDLAFLQYTSGSTSEPRGVMVSHANLLYNLEMIRTGFGIPWTERGEGPGTGVFWLPAYHDMGLIGGILMPLYTGGHSVLMSPAAFLQRPLRWLKAISEHRANVSGGPNFAYELCCRKISPADRERIDLSSWKIAFCGAEPIRAETLERFAEQFADCGFRREAFYPCYGLAEATLIAAGGQGPAEPTCLGVDRAALSAHRVVESNGQPTEQVQQLVGCGNGLLQEQLAIVDPETLRSVEPGRVGEIWIKGPNVARGYWNRARETQEAFGARLNQNGDGPYLRTGDLGFVRDGQLYVTGRLKEVIIIRGRNHYPQDIELSVQHAHPALLPSAGAAFSVGENGHEQLVVVHEVDRQYRGVDLDEVIRSIRRTVAEEHELDLHSVVLIRQANLPRTTSGKVQRNLCRQRYLAGQLRILAEWGRPSSCTGPVGGRQSKQRPEPARTKPADGAARHGTCSSGASGTGASAAGTNGKLRRMIPSGREATDAEVRRLAEAVEGYLLQWLIERGGVAAEKVGRDRPFAEYGLDSVTAVEMTQQLEDSLGVRLAPVMVWNYPTPAAMSQYLAELACGRHEPEDHPHNEGDIAQEAGEFEHLLSQIEALSDEDAEAALDGNPDQQ